MSGEGFEAFPAQVYLLLDSLKNFPMLTLAPIDGISKTVIILTYLFADGYTNVLYPTCGTLLVGIGLAGVSFTEWFKKTILFQLLLFAISIAFLMIAVFIKL